jgi:predicted Zn-dependent protease
MHATCTRLLLTAACAVALAALAGCRVNPVTGRSELVLVSETEEVAIGYQAHPDVIFMYDGEYHDRELNRYLGTIVMRLHAVSHRPQFPMEFTMLSTSVVNAFATPGHVYATRGFLARLENEAQFAAAMGHEFAHVAAGHTAKQMTQSMLTGLVLGVADYAAGSSLAGQVATNAGQVGVTLLGLSYSREQELQADRVGAYYMALAGWDPRQAVRIQELLESLSKRKEAVLDRYLSTHPPGEDRRAEIEAVIDEKGLLSGGFIQGDGLFTERWTRHLSGLREVDKAFAPYERGIKLLADGKPGEALAAADGAIGMNGDQAQFHRLRGDALLGLKRYGDAETAYRRSLAADPRYVPANIGLGKLYQKTGQRDKAESEFAVAVHGWPDGLEGYYGLGLARLSQERYEDALQPLAAVAQAAPGNPQVLYALASCYDRTGRPAEARAAYRQALSAGLAGTEKSQAEQRLRSLDAPSR